MHTTVYVHCVVDVHRFANQTLEMPSRPHGLTAISRGRYRAVYVWFAERDRLRSSALIDLQDGDAFLSRLLLWIAMRRNTIYLSRPPSCCYYQGGCLSALISIASTRVVGSPPFGNRCLRPKLASINWEHGRVPPRPHVTQNNTKDSLHDFGEKKSPQVPCATCRLKGQRFAGGAFTRLTRKQTSSQEQQPLNLPCSCMTWLQPRTALRIICGLRDRGAQRRRRHSFPRPGCRARPC
jgi:hypothetical protein